jgi:hypothetical protein
MPDGMSQPPGEAAAAVAAAAGVLAAAEAAMAALSAGSTCCILSRTAWANSSPCKPAAAAPAHVLALQEAQRA